MEISIIEIFIKKSNLNVNELYKILVEKFLFGNLMFFILFINLFFFHTCLLTHNIKAYPIV